MSYPTQPPQQPGGNPYAQSPQPQQPGGNPYAQNPQPQQPGQFGGGFPAPPAPARGNAGLGILVAFVVALVTAGIYGGIMGAVEAEVGYAAVGVGFLIGFAAGKTAGRNPATAVVSAVLALVAVYLGQILGIAILAAKETPFGVMELLTQHFSLLNEVWKEDLDPLSFLFFALGAVGAFSGTKKAAA
ncbi:hypothetical protein ACIQM4_07990 [Streptomyces sp. NPDC091272]|uniref:hypothetical protein n=1 Tax=Streptomyces sp. NPDC091272 TaxID=3365981 RepID=UPI0037FF3341